MLAERALSHLLIIDIQERLAPAIHNNGLVEKNASRLIAYAGQLGVPVTFTEQMPERIGRTLPSLRDIAGGAPVVEKATFSCWREPTFKKRMVELRQQSRSQIVVAGMEAHVCVMQTVLELLANDFEVLVVADAIGSRVEENKKLALARMAKAGAVVASQEMIAFEWLERANTAEFKGLLPLFK
ncbi:MAG: isochorismatase family protein [Hyphomicrobiaceae bacterium]|nr:isochorismatase family protein [Hyphomicrobiaceae bacterium]